MGVACGGWSGRAAGRPVGAGSLAGEYICIHDSMFWGASQVRMRPGRERESLTQQLVTRL